MELRVESVQSHSGSIQVWVPGRQTISEDIVNISVTFLPYLTDHLPSALHLSGLHPALNQERLTTLSHQACPSALPGFGKLSVVLVLGISIVDSTSIKVCGNAPSPAVSLAEPPP